VSDYISESDSKLNKRDQKARAEGSSPGTINKQSGIGNSVRREAFPKRKETVAEKVWAGYNNSYIAIGKDRIDTEDSGYGGKGKPQSGMIHLVAGHFGANLEDYRDDPNNQDGVDPSFMIDSSYIYISQRADIDDYLNLVDGTVGNSKSKSAIGIKADDVRIIGERGIKLVTRRYKQDSFRKDSYKINGIDLIAGNDDKGLQPMLKGRNTVESLRKMATLLQQTVEIFSQALVYQMKANSEIASHQHITSTPKDPTLPLKASLQIACNGTNENFSEHVFKEVSNILSDIGLYKQKYLEESGEIYIASKFNNTN